MTKIQNYKRVNVLNLEYLNFEFVSNLEFRA